MIQSSTVDIVLSVYNGGRYIAEQIRSIQAQTYQDWRLWIRDDGSSDDSKNEMEEIAATDGRIHSYGGDGKNLGSGPGFGWLLERLPQNARYVFCSDADDVWLPGKIEISIAAMLRAEADPGPILVHTDMVVTDERLQMVHASLWRYVGIQPDPVSLCRLLTHNVVTGPTILMNRDLFKQVCPIPPEAAYQDTWIALVAAAFGRTVALSEPTVLYRRHKRSSTSNTRVRGQRAPGLAGLVEKLVGRPGRAREIRAWVLATARQAEAFLLQYGPLLSADDRELLREYSSIPGLSFLPRKLSLIRSRSLRAQGILRYASFVLGA